MHPARRSFAAVASAGRRQTLTEIAAEKNSTIIFPLPIDLISMVTGRTKA